MRITKRDRSIIFFKLNDKLLIKIIPSGEMIGNEFQRTSGMKLVNIGKKAVRPRAIDVIC